MRDEAPGPASTIIERVVRRNPNSPEAWRAYTMALLGPFEHGRCRSALAHWEALDPQDPRIAAVKAGLAYSDTDFEEALAWANKALERYPTSFQMLWAKAMSERFLRLPSHLSSLDEARRVDPARFQEEMECVGRAERYGPLELQNAFERLFRMGAAADEADFHRARRLLELSKSEGTIPDAWAELRQKMERRLEEAERRRRGRPSKSGAPLRRARKPRAPNGPLRANE